MKLALFFPNSLINPNFQKWPKLINYYGCATMSHGCKGCFSLCNHDGLLQKGYFHEIFQWNSHLLWKILKSGVQNAIFMGKSQENSLFATVSHRCKGKNILCNYDSWLQRIFFHLQTWLTVAKRLISWDFPILFMKMSWLLQACIYLWIWQKRADSISHSSKYIPRIKNLI